MPTVFTPKLSATQSADAKTLEILDLSNWVDNTNRFVINNFTRQVVLKDSAGSVISSLSFLGSSISVSTPVSKDQFIKAELVITGAQSFTTFINISLDRYAANKRLKLLSCKCGKGCKIDSRLLSSEPYFEGAYDATLSGNGPLFDKYITAAYDWLNSSPN